MMKKSLLITAAAATLALSLPMTASAESQLIVGSGTAVARLDFRVIIPRVLFLAVGTGNGTPIASNSTIDTLTFDYSAAAADVGNGTASAAQSVAVRVRGNNGQVALTATTSGALTTADGDVIPWSQITPSSDAGTLPTPALPLSGPGTSSNVTLNAGKITDRTANWSFVYENDNIVAPGTYGTTNGRVTYTASMP
ncbi:hypothetical protein [Ideonella livida]|uniref:Uncharacterized protein n=1 Tax=Ideonella livida TaxID=2707176 RepID=A0A7C9TLL6_9BURK|nr:hypothetical protein [Ideonella livida]NDY93461.1 hypothetical protein [Ideonella livida]